MDERINELLVAWLDGRARQEDRRELEAWIEASPENGRLFRETVNVWELMHPAFDPESIDVEAAERKVLARIDRRPVWEVVMRYWQRVAAVVILPLALCLYFRAPQGGSRGGVVWQEVTSPNGMVSELDLPDGSRVWLNGGSRLRYPVTLGSVPSRCVELHGEGYFEVQSDTARPFTVETADLRLTATGTAFNVEAYDGDSVTAVSIISGQVDVSFEDGYYYEGEASHGRALGAGDRFVFHRLTSSVEVGLSENPYRWYAWKDGMMLFRGDPLWYVFKRLERTFNVEFIMESPDMDDAPYRATFSNEALDEILRMLELSAPIRFVYQNRYLPAEKHEKQRIIVTKTVVR